MFPNDSTRRAFLYADGATYNLNSLLVEPFAYTLTGASKVTDLGMIVASAPTGLWYDPVFRPVLLIPVPEPSAFALLTAAALVLLIRPQRMR